MFLYWMKQKRRILGKHALIAVIKPALRIQGRDVPNSPIFFWKKNSWGKTTFLA